MHVNLQKASKNIKNTFGYDTVKKRTQEAMATREKRTAPGTSDVANSFSQQGECKRRMQLSFSDVTSAGNSGSFHQVGAVSIVSQDGKAAFGTPGILPPTHIPQAEVALAFVGDAFPSKSTVVSVGNRSRETSVGAEEDDMAACSTSPLAEQEQEELTSSYASGTSSSSDAASCSSYSSHALTKHVGGTSSTGGISSKDDPWGPYQIQQRVQLVVDRWGKIDPIRPDLFLSKLLSSRGYDASIIPAPDLRR